MIALAVHDRFVLPSINRQFDHRIDPKVRSVAASFEKQPN